MECQRYLKITQHLKLLDNMTTFNRLSRFSKESIDLMDSQDTNVKYNELNLISIDVKSTNCIDSLIKIPLEQKSYSENLAYKLFDFNFKEYVESEVVVEDVTDRNKILELENIISELKYKSSESMLDAHKDMIIDLRLKAKQGNVFSDFSDRFPYEPINKIDGNS